LGRQPLRRPHHGLLALIKRGVRVLAATGDDLTDTGDPSRIMMRQIAGSFAQYEKARVVAKLRGARERSARDPKHRFVTRLRCNAARAACNLS
jgi:DNA invertase Pin-like site-specific DNA recombinase